MSSLDQLIADRDYIQPISGRIYSVQDLPGEHPLAWVESGGIIYEIQLDRESLPIACQALAAGKRLRLSYQLEVVD